MTAVGAYESEADASLGKGSPVIPADLGEKELGEGGSGHSLNNDAIQSESNGSSAEENEYPKGAVLAGICLAIVSCVLLTALDNTIIVTAIPKITDQFHGIDKVSWYGTAYYITNGSFQSAWGKIYRYFPIKYTYLLAIFIFELGSLISAASPNSIAFIFGRAISGMGAAGLSTGAYTIIAHISELRQRPTYMGMVGFAFGIGSIIAPLIGGAFTDKVTWRWCFYINLPVGGLAAAIIVLLFRIPAATKSSDAPWREKLRQQDVVGIILFMGFNCSFLLAMEWGGQTKAWSSSDVVGLLVGAVAIAVAFVLWESYLGERAMVVPRVWKMRKIYLNCLFTFFFGGSFIVCVYYIPIYFQSVKNTSAIDSGVRTLPVIATYAVFAILVGVFISLTGHIDAAQVVGAAIATVGVGLLISLDLGSPSSKWIPFQIIAGIGWGIAFQNGIMKSQIGMPMGDIPCASSMMLASLFFGASAIVSVGQAAFINTIGTRLRHDAPHIELAQVIATGAAELRQVYSGSDLTAVINAYMHGINVVFAFSTACVGLSFIFALWESWGSTARKDLLKAKAQSGA